MTKQENTRSKEDARKLRAVKFAELEATDEFEHERAIKHLTDPSTVGLSKQHAELVSEKLRKAYVNDIMAKYADADDEDDDYREEKKEGSEFSIPGHSEEDEDQGDEPEDKPQGKKPPFMKERPITDEEEKFPASVIEKAEEETPAEGLGMGELEEEISDESPTQEFGFPSEEEEPEVADEFGGPEIGAADEALSPGEETQIELPGGYTLSLKLLENLSQGLESQGLESEGLEPEGLDPEGLEPEGLESEGLELPILKPEGLEPRKEVNDIMAKTNRSTQERQAARRELLASIIKEAEQQMPEDIKPSTEKPLGNDTSSLGKPFVKEDATRGVANQGIEGDKMTLSNSEGNSLLWDPKFTENRVPTVNPELLANSSDAFDATKFSTEKEGLFTRQIKETEDPIPTMGDTDALWGKKNMIQGFDLPTQLDTTTQRRTNVLHAQASKTVECAGCTNPEEKALFVVACDTCGNQIPLCDECVGENYCPVCASADEENIKEACGPNWEAYCKTPKDRAEVVEDNRGDGDLNNDGGFRVKKSEEDDEGDGNYNLEVNASIQKKVAKLEKDNQELQLTLAKYAKAAETAAVMAYAEDIEVTDIPETIGKFMSDKMLNAAGLEHLRQTIASMAKKRYQERVAKTGKGMERNASPKPFTSSGIGFNPNPSQERPFDHIADMKEALKGIFSYPKEEE